MAPGDKLEKKTENKRAIVRGMAMLFTIDVLLIIQAKSVYMRGLKKKKENTKRYYIIPNNESPKEGFYTDTLD